MDKHIHNVRRITNPKSFSRYECLDCGKRLRILSGVIVAQTPTEVDAYYQRKRQRVLDAMKNEEK